MILNAVAMIICAGGAAMLVPAAYSLLKAPDEAWIFWSPGVIVLSVGAVLYYPTRGRPRSYVSRQSMFLMVVACWLGVVLVGTLPLMLSGRMGPVDAFFNSMAGFTTTGAATVTPEELSLALLLWRSLSQWIGGIGIIVLFVAIAPQAGFGATQLYTAARRGLGRAVGNAELLTYLGVILASTLLITADLSVSDHRDSLATAFREALFQSASLITGTAFSTTDWSAWPPFSVALLVLIMAVGGCAGSTAGGMKAIRVYLLSRNAAQEMFRLVHPRAVTPLVLGDRLLPERIRAGVLGFFFVYVATVAVGTLLIALHQVPVGQAFGSVFSCVNITGAFPGAAGTPQFYADLPATAKTMLAILMLLGRLELFTVLVLLSPAFWRA